MARRIFVIGPAAAIKAYFFLSTKPFIITPPGAAKIKPKKELTTAINSILLSALNSAKHLYFWAKYL